MNQIRLGSNWQIEGSPTRIEHPLGEFFDKQGIYVFDPEVAATMGAQRAAHQRRAEFLSGEGWDVSSVIPPQQRSVHQRELALHATIAARLGNMSSLAAEAEVIPFNEEQSYSSAELIAA